MEIGVDFERHKGFIVKSDPCYCYSKDRPDITSQEQETRRLLLPKVQRLRRLLAPMAKNPLYKSGLDLSDMTLTQWLKACDNDVVIANARLHNSLLFRHKYNVDYILTCYTPPDALINYYPGGLCGVDKEGCPVYYELFGLVDMGGIIQCVTKRDLILFKIYQYEKIDQAMRTISKDSGRPIDSMLMIVDLQGSSKQIFSSPNLRAWAQVIEVLQDLYPALVKETLFINDPNGVFSEAYLALRPYLKQSTLKTMKFLGINYYPHLRHRIEKHQIPAYLGGYKCDYDNNPFCRSNINWEHHIPAWMNLSDQRRAARVCEKVVLAGEKVVEEYHVSLVNCFLHWRFHTITRPFLFSIYTNTSSEENYVVKPVLINMSSTQRHGLIICHKAARYFICLDNHKNHTHPVKVVYDITIKPPEGLMAGLAPSLPLGDTIQFWMPINAREEQLRQEVAFRRPGFKWKKIC